MRLVVVCVLLVTAAGSRWAHAELPLLGEIKPDQRQTGVRGMAIDGEGFMWATSDAGLCRSNGRAWTCPESSCAGNIIATAAGDVFSCVDVGSVMKLKGHSRVRLNIAGITEKVQLVGAAENTLFLASTTGTFAWDQLSPPVRLLSSPAISVARWQDVTWLATTAGLYRVQGDATPEMVARGPCKQVALSVRGEAFVIVEHNAGPGLELVTFNSGGTPRLAQYEGWTNEPYSLAIDEGNNLLWVGHGGGLLAFPLTGGKAVFKRSMREGIPYPIVSALLRDAQGLWMGTLQGLAQMSINPPIFNVGRAEGIDSDSTFSVTTTPDGALWMSQYVGVSRYQNGNAYNAYASDGLRHIDLRSVAVAPNGDVWASGIINTLVRLDLTTNRFTAVPLRDQPSPFAIQMMRFGPTGTLWMGLVDGGLGRMQNGSFVSVYGGRLNTENRVRDVLQNDNGAIWFGRQDGTIVSLQDGQTTIFSLEPKAEALCLHQDVSGAVWVGSGGAGLFRIKEGQVDRVTREQGLWDDRIHAVIGDDHGWLWMSSPRGVFRVSQTQVEAVMDKWTTHFASTSYQREDGLRNNEASRGFGPSCAKDTQGRLLFSTVGGVAVFDPQTLLRAAPPLSVNIDTVTINGVPVTTEGQRSAVGAGAVSFRYSAPALWSASRIRHRVRLLGLNPAWMERDHGEQADFSGVPAGRYTFEVQVFSADRPELERQARFTFELLPPIYRRAWFGIAAVLACAALVLALLRARVLRLRRMQAALSSDRSRIAQDIHDSLEQDLCGVKLQVDAADLWINKDPARARQHLARASDLVADGMVDMRTAIWGLRQGWVQGAELALGLEQRLRRMTDAAQVQLTFVVHGQAPNLPSMFATQLSYIARESVTNAIKHAQAQHLNVRLDFQETGKARLFVQDDGVGMPVQGLVTARDDNMPSGLGLDGMRARAELIKGTLAVTSSPQGGTTIEVQAAYLRT